MSKVLPHIAALFLMFGLGEVIIWFALVQPMERHAFELGRTLSVGCGK